MVDEKLSTTQQSTLAAQKANCIHSYMKSIARGAVTLPFHSALSRFTSPEALHSALRSLAKGHEAVGLSPEHQEDYQRVGGPLLRRQAEEVSVQPAEEKSLERPHLSLPVLEGRLQESWGGTLYQRLQR